MFLYDGWLTRVGDYIIKSFYLGVIWVLGSLPIITIGASTTAAYYTSMKLVENKDEKILKNYLHSYKQNLIQSIILSSFIFIMGYCMMYFYYNITYFNQLGQGIISLYRVASLIALIIILNLFAILSKFNLKCIQVIKLSIVFCYVHPSIVLKNTLVFILSACIFIIFPIYSFLAIGLYFLIASRGYHKVFNRIINDTVC